MYVSSYPQSSLLHTRILHVCVQAIVTEKPTRARLSSGELCLPTLHLTLTKYSTDRLIGKPAESNGVY